VDGQTWLFLIGIALLMWAAIALAMRQQRRKMLIEKYGEETGLRIFEKRIWQGMTKEQLLDSWGRPADLDCTVYKTKTKETWKYNQIGKNRFNNRVYVENGAVVGWKQQ
jgi:hypothetical protein